MIDMTKEEVFSLSRATQFVPAVDGNRVHTSTLWRWCVKGCKGVRLEHIRLGRRILTSHEAINRFANRLARKEERELLQTLAPAKEFTVQFSDTEREKAIEQAGKELSANGININPK